MRLFVSLILCCFLLTGCANTSQIVVGKQRAAIAPEQVKIYVDAPKHYEKVAILDSWASDGMTQQHNTDMIIADMKKKAAALGANGILLLNTDAGGTNMSGFGTGYNSNGTTSFSSFFASEMQSKAKAYAIYVGKPKRD